MRALLVFVLAAQLLSLGLVAPLDLYVATTPAPPALAADGPCPASAPGRTFDVIALRVPISYNHWGDYDLEGRMFVLREEAPAMIVQVASALADAGLDTTQFVAETAIAAGISISEDPSQENAQAQLEAIAASVGLRLPEDFPGDLLRPDLKDAPRTQPFDVSELVRPLVVRAHLGDCVDMNLLNLLPQERVSLHVHEVLAEPGQGVELGENDAGQTIGLLELRTYRFYIPPGIENEGAHLFHSHADARYQTKHGLFGAIVAEPAGSSWLDPDGTESLSGPEAMIVRDGAADFREFVLIYHDEVELVDRSQEPLPVISIYGEYGPGSKAINYRSEPFMDRFDHNRELFADGVVARDFDKSQGYGSYTYGDPATFIPRSYVEDPTKFRLLNAGPGQHHVHHLHGGGDRWRVSPYSDDTQFDDGLMKVNPIVRSKSERIDVQSIGPGESFDAEIEGGSGGTQAGVGDFLFHCHIVEHYVAGMWSFWRVFNTAQDGLAELPDREGIVPGAVDSIDLIGEVMPDGTVLDEDNLDEWIEPQLPPAGVPDEDDASVWDWTVEQQADGPLYLGEPETAIAWPNYESATPGERPALLFNPDDGRLSYPFLKPHFGKRPPFAPAHGPAPYLGNDVGPGRPDGLCPPTAPIRSYLVDALAVPVNYNKHNDIDPDGQIFALAQDKADIESGAKDPTSLVIRANQGDCVDILLASDLPDNAENHEHSKVNMHIHLVQFDVQASDGVITGFNYEQSVRPATLTGTELAGATSPGASTITVADGAALRVGTLVGIGLLEPTVEVREIVAISGNEVTFDSPLANAHAAGERVSTEFVRYRWYADVELGIVYWHDHVDGLNGWRHGLFGSLIVEPNGAAWRDPATGALDQATSHVVDIIAPDRAFREYVVQFQDRGGCIADADLRGRCDEAVFPNPPFPEAPEPLSYIASFNLRSAPFHHRSAGLPLLSTVGNASAPSTPVGDPDTDVWRAYVGDPVMVRYLHTGQSLTTGMGTFGIKGHRFPLEQNSPDSRLRDAISAGISSHHNLWLDCGAGGCAKQAGDYLYGMTQPDLMERGAWGIFRVHDAVQGDLLTLPGYASIAGGSLPAGPVRHYDVVALETDVVANAEGQNPLEIATKLFAIASQEADILADVIEPQPLVLRALPGERIEVTLTNHLDEAVTLHAGLLLGDPMDLPIGTNGDTRVAPGASRTYTWYADEELGTVYLTSYAQPAQHAIDGLYGAIVIEPAGSAFSPATGPSADVTLASGDVAREQVLFYASDDAFFEGSVMPYTIDVPGNVLVNYRTEPLEGRIGPVGHHSCHESDACTEQFIANKQQRTETRNSDIYRAFSSIDFWDPQTPLVTATTGQTLLVRAVSGAGDQLVVHSFAGGAWKQDPQMAGSNLIDAATLGPGETSDAWLVAGEPGDYLWGDHREAFLEAGAWGIVRVE